jgi:hypothetical protein
MRHLHNKIKENLASFSQHAKSSVSLLKKCQVKTAFRNNGLKDSDEESSNQSIEVQETIQSSSILSPNTIRKNNNSNSIKRNHNNEVADKYRSSVDTDTEKTSQTQSLIIQEDKHNQLKESISKKNFDLDDGKILLAKSFEYRRKKIKESDFIQFIELFEEFSYFKNINIVN